MADAGVVRDECEIAGTLIDHGMDQLHRRAGPAEPAHEHDRPVANAGDGLFKCRNAFVEHAAENSGVKRAGLWVDFSRGLFQAQRNHAMMPARILRAGDEAF